MGYLVVGLGLQVNRLYLGPKTVKHRHKYLISKRTLLSTPLWQLNSNAISFQGHLEQSCCLPGIWSFEKSKNLVIEKDESRGSQSIS